MPKEDLLKYVAYLSLVLTVLKAIWPELTSVVRMIWSDVMVALTVTSMFQSAWVVVLVTLINIILVLMRIAQS